MNQPPDDDFYNDATAHADFSPQQRPGQPSVPPWPQSAPNNYPRQGPPGGQPGPAWQPGPMNQPQFTPPQQGPASQPGFGPPNMGRAGQPSWDNGPQNAGMPPQRQPGYPPPSGPISRPGFSNTSRPLDVNPFAATDPATFRPANNQPNGNPAAPWSQPPQPQQPGPGFGPGPASGPGPAPWNQPQQGGPGPGPAPWNQPPQTPPPGPAPWNQPPNNALPNWNNQPPQPTTPPKKPRLGLIITLVILALVVVIGGTASFLYLRSSHGGNTSTGTPTAQSTASSTTPVATKPAGTTPTTSSGGLNAIGTPVQAGNEWIVTVTSVKETGSSLIPPGANNTYLEINLTLKNTSGSTLALVSYLYFTLDNGKHETLGDTNVRHTPDGNVSAGQTLNAQIAFEVPKSQHTFTFTFAYGLSHNTNAAVSWQLTA